MANNTKHIHEIEPELASSEIDGTEVLVVSNPNGTGYDTNKVSIGSIAEFARDGANSNGLTMERIFNQIYPVGSIYTTIDKTFDPGTAFGGTWSVIGNGRCLFGLSRDSSDVGQEINSTLPKLDVTFSGSTANVSITQQMVNGAGTATNNQSRPAIGAGGGSVQGSFTATGTVSIPNGAISATTQRNGSSQSVVCNNENNDVRPPSIGVIFWKRTA